MNFFSLFRMDYIIQKNLIVNRIVICNIFYVLKNYRLGYSNIKFLVLKNIILKFKRVSLFQDGSRD